MRTTLLTTLLLLFMQATAYDIKEGGIYYNLYHSTKTAEVTYADMFDNDSAYIGSVSIPSTISYGDSIYRVTRIDQYAFAGCAKLNDVSIPQTVKFVGIGAFSGCKNLVSVILPDTLRNLALTFKDCSSLGYVRLPDSLRTIGNQMFQNCTSLVKVDFPDSLEAIGANAFDGCTSLPEVTLPDSLLTIGQFAFSGCTNLMFMKLGKNLKRIDVYAFNNLTGLTELECWAHTPPAAMGAFSGIDYDRVTLYVPAGCQETYAATHPWELFYHTAEIDPTGIRLPQADSPEPRYYDFGGRPAKSPQRGLYIKRMPGERGRKILMR